jgi:hypothetical protein
MVRYGCDEDGRASQVILDVGGSKMSKRRPRSMLDLIGGFQNNFPFLSYLYRGEYK